MGTHLWEKVQPWVEKALAFVLKEPQEHIILQSATSSGKMVNVNYKVITKPSNEEHVIEALHSKLMLDKLKFMIHSIAESALKEYWSEEGADALTISLEGFATLPFSVRVETSLSKWRKASASFLKALAAMLHVPVSSIAEMKVIQSGKMVGLVFELQIQKDQRKGAALTLSSSDTLKKMQKWIPPDARVEGGLAITPKFTHDSA
jgi:hypothetical protein